MTTSALELRGVEKSFGATPIIRGVSLDVRRGERHADHRTQRRRQVDAVQLDQRALRADAGIDPLERRGHRRRAALSRSTGADWRAASR